MSGKHHVHKWLLLISPLSILFSLFCFGMKIFDAPCNDYMWSCQKLSFHDLILYSNKLCNNQFMSAVSTGNGKLCRVGTYGVIPCHVGTTQSVNTKLHSLTLKYFSICFLKAELKCSVAESESVGSEVFG